MSDPPTRPDLVVVGRLGAPFGVRGEMKLRPTNGPGVFVAGKSFATGRASDATTLACTGVRRHHETLLVSFDGITSPEDARPYVNVELFAPAADVPLEAGEYFDRDLVGCDLIDAAGTNLGCVVGVEHFPAQDCLIVGASRAYVPLVRAFVRSIDVARKRIDVDLPAGLLD